MKKSQLIIVLVAVLLLFLLSGCEEPGKGIVTKEPKKELSEIPERKGWSVTDVEGYGE